MTIKKIEKPKKISISSLQKKADRLYQEVGRKIYDRCLLGCGEYSCLHHFVKKSQSTALRYDFENGINICNRHHCGIHQGKMDTVTAHIVLIKGKDWLDNLEKKKREGAGIHYGKRWYEEKIAYLEMCLEEGKAVQ